MAFDMGFDFRNTSAFVTDPSYGVPVLAETFPHTYTAGNGNSINAGWDVATSPADRSSTNDPRIAGINFAGTNLVRTFTIDLGSGSAPGSGTYTIDMAVGDAASAQDDEATVFDNVTALITLPRTLVNIGHFIDATLTDVTASSSWTGTTVSKTFASTTAKITLNPSGGSGGNTLTTLAHFRLTLQSAAAAPPRMLMLLGVGV